MSILTVAIRILYDIHGFGEWEKSLSSHGGSSPTLDQIGKLDLTCDSDSGKDSVRVSGSPYHNLDDLGTKYNRNSSEVQKSELDAAELLHKLEASYNEIADSYEYSKDLPTYLQYCKDVAFAGLEPSFEDHEEERLIEEFWDFYQKEKDSEPAEPLEERRSSAFNQKRSRNKEWSSHIFNDNKKVRDERCVSSPSADDGTYCADDSPGGWDDGDHSSQSSEGDQNLERKGQASAEILKNEAIIRMKLDMEGNRFLYIPPRVNVKRFDTFPYEEEG